MPKFEVTIVHYVVIVVEEASNSVEAEKIALEQYKEDNPRASCRVAFAEALTDDSKKTEE